MSNETITPYRYFITSMDDGETIGTNNPEVADDYAQSETYVVVDTARNATLFSDGTTEDIREEAV